MLELFKISKQSMQEQIYDLAIELINKSNKYITTRYIRTTYMKKMQLPKNMVGIDFFKRKVNNNLKVVMMLLIETNKLKNADKKGLYIKV